jgi:hypothetical protein
VLAIGSRKAGKTGTLELTGTRRYKNRFDQVKKKTRDLYRRLVRLVRLIVRVMTTTRTESKQSAKNATTFLNFPPPNTTESEKKNLLTKVPLQWLTRVRHVKIAVGFTCRLSTPNPHLRHNNINNNPHYSDLLLLSQPHAVQGLKIWNWSQAP